MGLAAAVIICFVVVLCGIASAEEDSVKLVQRAYLDGELDYPTALNYKVYALFRKNRLPRIYQSDTVIKSATQVMLEARANQHLLLRDNLFILNRPTDAGDSDYYGSGIAVWTYNSPGGNFKIHYTEDNANGDAVYGSDGNQATIPQYVADLAAYLDYSWTQIIANMGYTAPPSDGTAGGDGRFDVYLIDMNAYGYTSYDTSPSNTYIVMENDFTGFPDNLDSDIRKGAQKATAGHEFFHASQLQYTANITANLWWMEATATWMEDIVYPAVKDYLNYTGRRYDDANDNGAWDSGEAYYEINGTTLAGTTARPSMWFDLPEYSLDSTQGSYEYGTVIWVKYLSKVYGNTMIKSVWDRIGSGAIALAAVSDELTARGASMNSAFASFQSANYKRDYPDGGYYPIIRHESTYTSYPQNISGTVNHLSSRYYAFKADSAGAALTLTFTNMNSGNLSVRLILTRTAGGYDEQDVSLNSPSVISQITNFGTSSTYSKAAAVVMNISTSLDGEAYSVSAGKGAPQGSSDSSGPCFIATAAYGSSLDPRVRILRDFRDNHLLTNPAGLLFVSFYYKISPPIADYISEHETMRIAARLALTPIVYAVMYPGWFFLATLVISTAFVLDRKRSGGCGHKYKNITID